MGAVLAAVVASVFGIKGTIVGVAIGSIAATTGTALVFQSIERTNKAVKQVAVRAPESSLLRRLGGTDVTGITESTPGQSSAPTEETATSAARGANGRAQCRGVRCSAHPSQPTQPIQPAPSHRAPGVSTGPL